jgi:hypothetical protein
METRKDVTKKLWKKRGYRTLLILYPSTHLDLDFLVYFGGFPDNLWIVILYMC